MRPTCVGRCLCCKCTITLPGQFKTIPITPAPPGRRFPLLTLRCRRCTRVDGRKAHCSALLTSSPPLIPLQHLFEHSNASDTDASPKYPDGNVVSRNLLDSSCVANSRDFIVFADLFCTFLRCRFMQHAPHSLSLCLRMSQCHLWAPAQRNCPNYSTSERSLRQNPC